MSDFLAMKEEILSMKEHGGGATINTASEAGLAGAPQAAQDSQPRSLPAAWPGPCTGSSAPTAGLSSQQFCC